MIAIHSRILIHQFVKLALCMIRNRSYLQIRTLSRITIHGQRFCKMYFI